MGKKNKKDIKESKESVQEELKENVDVEMEDKNEPEETDQTDIGSEMTELRDKYLRLYAEFENYKKRTIREKLDMMKTAAQDTLAAILPVLDDFDRAKKVSDDDNSEESFSEGVTLVYHKLYTVLKNKGLEEMQSTGEIFDPEYHEAVTEIPAPSEDMKGKVVDTIEKGYMLKDRIIRHAKVVVGK
jgi:molecular chaperone GrpE